MKLLSKFKGTFIYSGFQALVRNTTSYAKFAHGIAVEKRYYFAARDWLLNIIFVGFILWLITITFVKYFSVWTIPVFGIAEWMALELISEIKKKWTF